MSDADDAQDVEQPAVGDVPGQAAIAEDVAQGSPTDEFGPALRAAREKAGLSIANVAHALKVTEFTVDALEDERYEDLPPRPYIRGYIQRYARLVGLDAGTVMVGFDTVEAEPPVVPAVVPRSRWVLFSDFARDSWGMIYGGIVLVFVILIGGALWWAWPGGNSAQTEPVAEAAPNTAAALVSPDDDNRSMPDVDAAVVSTVRAERDQVFDSTPAVPRSVEPVAVDPPVPEAPATESVAVDPPVPQVRTREAVAIEPPHPEGGAAEPGFVGADTDGTTSEVDGLARLDVMAFVFEGECWVEVRDRDGDLVHGDLGRDGETVTVSGHAPFSVLVGNTAVVDISFNGGRVALDSTARGEVARLVVGD
ncbi:MAG: helix-turn-helix domain-containing protein [Pseudomonadales bacterium]|nr:helix-turn-helix domain-containing protein [Pseudomonadales bacterium]